VINKKKFESVHIVGFGGYIPYWRLGVDQVGSNWGIESKRIKTGLGVTQKAVANQDEDALTMAVEASVTALERSGIDPKKIGAVFIGSESHPYAVKPTGTILADILQIGPDYFCADLQFACKAGTAGLQIVASFIEAGIIDYGLVVAVDKAQSKPGDALEYTAAAGAAAFILGNKQKDSKDSIANLEYTYSYASDTPDFWRRPREKFPSHGGRFTGEPGYFSHVEQCLQNFFQQTNTKPQNFDHVIFHMPNSKFPLKVAKKFGFSSEQINPGLLVPHIGNPYAASSPLGLVSTLEHIQEQIHTQESSPTQNQNTKNILKDILVISYGSGAGSDAFWFKTTNKLAPIKHKKIAGYLKNYKTIDYLEYLKKWEAI